MCGSVAMRARGRNAVAERKRDSTIATVADVAAQVACARALRGGEGEDTGPLTAGFGARRDPQTSDDKIGPETLPADAPLQKRHCEAVACDEPGVLVRIRGRRGYHC